MGQRKSSTVIAEREWGERASGGLNRVSKFGNEDLKLRGRGGDRTRGAQEKSGDSSTRQTRRKRFEGRMAWAMRSMRALEEGGRVGGTIRYEKRMSTNEGIDPGENGVRKKGANHKRVGRQRGSRRKASLICSKSRHGGDAHGSFVVPIGGRGEVS